MLNKKALKKKYGEEMVFVVPFNRVEHIEDHFTPSIKTIDSLDIYDTLGNYVLRYDAEGNSSMQQLIPYSLIKNKEGKFFVSKRIAGDERLVESYSLGFGGHIDSSDGAQSVIIKGLRRELNEEVNLRNYHEDLKLIGTVRDLNGPTPEHTGFVFILTVDDADIKENDKLVGSWMTFDELVEHFFQFESWSKYIIDYYYTLDN